jgi:hypothetical protein
VKKILNKLIVTSLLVTSATYANSSDDKYYSRSLVGFEGSYSSFEIKDTSATKKKENFGAVGIKIGAETKNVRMFLSARNGFMGNENYEYSSAFMYGAELQYMINIDKMANFYFGANIGKVNFKFDDLDENKRVYTTQYVGGDVGFNVHLDDSLDLELGGRLMTLSDSQHTLNAVTYTFDDIITGYMSLIFKYQMD